MPGAHSRLAGVLLVSACFLVMGAAPQQHDNPRQADPKQELWRLRNEGLAHFESGIGLKKARAVYEAALQLHPDSAVELFNLGTVQRKLGELDAAITTLQRALRADNSLPNAHYTLGLIYRGKGDARQALTEFEQARRLAPAEASSYYQLGRLYREAGRNQEALQSFVDALALNPTHTGALYQLHLYYQERGETQKSQQTFEEFSRLKRALSASRKEANDDESELSRPLLGVAPAAASGGADASDLSFKLSGSPLATDVVAFDFNDIDDDGLEDFIFVDKRGRVQLMRNQGGGRFESTLTASLPAKTDVRSISLRILARGEGFRAVVAARQGVYVSTADTRATQLAFTPISSTDASHGVSFVDLDHDGDVDIVVGRFQEVLINEGNAHFHGSPYLDAQASEIVKTGLDLLTFADFDGQNAMDAVVYPKGQPRLLRDALGGKHVLASETLLPPAGTVFWSAATDIDGDGRIDLLSLTDRGLSIHYNTGPMRFTPAAEAARYTKRPAQRPLGALGDFDNDGRPDVLVIAAYGNSFVWRNIDGRKFSSQSLPVTLDPDIHTTPIVVDIDNDGRLDVAVLQSSGQLSWIQNTTPHVGGWVKVTLKGLRSAPSGLHAEVEARRGTFYTKAIASGRPVQLGLGQGNYAEVVRVTWSDGFVESKFKVDGNTRWTFPESERVSGSCPSVHAWNGERFNFVTDAFISGPMGVPMRPGRYFPVDHDEYVRIPGDLLRIDHGRLVISVTEELREAVFLDKAKLFAVDHPAGVEVYPNEYLMPGEAPQFKLHVLSDPRPPLQAIDQTGQDVLDLIRTADHRYPAHFRRLAYAGFAEPQGIELTLPPGAAAGPNLRLILTGWFYYFESTSLIAASQRADLAMIWPQIEIWRAGKWQSVMPVGLPLGKDKTVVIDLTRRLPRDTQRIRLWTNLALYWDRIALDTSPPPERATRIHSVPLVKATLGFHGFSGFLASDSRFPQPERFDYQTVRYAAPWNPLIGQYTRYGNVRSLLSRDDSRFAVFGSGDDLRLEFAADGLPALPKGWTRDYLLYLDGYVKDGDRYTAHAGRTDPLPFAGMQHYPYTSDEAHAAPWRTAAYQQYERRYQNRAPMHFTGAPLATAQPDRTSDSP